MKKIILIVGVIAIILALVIGGIYVYTQQPTPNGGKTASGTYSQISGATMINGKLAFVGTALTGKEVIVYDGKEYGSEYDKVYKPRLIGGRLVYSAYSKNGAETIYYIVDGDKVYTDTNDYYSISYPVDINSKLAFEAYVGGTKAESNGKSIIIYDGKKYGEQYAWASEIFNANGKLGYIAKEGLGVGKTFLVVDGEEIGKEYNRVESPTEINGKLAYIADNKKLVYDGQVIAEYDRFNHGYRDKSIVSVNGKPTAVAVKDNEYFVYYDGKEWKPIQHRTTDESFSPIYYGITDIGGKLAFEVQYEFCCPVMGDNPSVEGFVFYDGKEYGLEYDSARSPFELKSELAYIAKEDGKEFVIVDGNKLTEGYSHISFASEVNGKLIYIAKKGITYSVYEQ
jgi:hypothetical protein